MKIKKVKFIDSCIIDEQTSEVARPLIIEAVGFLVQESDSYITLARELVNGDYRGQISIPKKTIIK